MFATGEKFDKDGSVHTFARISKGRAKLSLPSLLWLQIKCESELCFSAKMTKVEQMHYLLHICNPRKYSFEGQIHVIAQCLLQVKSLTKMVCAHICEDKQRWSKNRHYSLCFGCN